MARLSIVIPVYNESNTIEKLIKEVDLSPYEKEIIAVDDGSSDGSLDILEKIKNSNDVELKLFSHRQNQGKGAALMMGFKAVTGDIVIIQDADMELDPSDYPILVEPILTGKAHIVYGSRFLLKRQRKPSLGYMGNRILTIMTNFMMNLSLTDMETGYKVFLKEVLDHINMRSKGFGFEPEFTCKVAKRGYKIKEVPISYSARSYEEGKKISWKDGIGALLTILYFRFFD